MSGPNNCPERADVFADIVRARRSVRAFLDQPVPQPLIEQIFTQAQQAPSNCNTQPWRTWVVSGAIHVVILTIAILVGRYGTVTAKPSDEIIAAVVDTPPDEAAQKDLTNPDLGLDSDLKAAVEVENEADVNVETKVTPNEPPGVASAENTNPIDVPSLAGLGDAGLFRGSTTFGLTVGALRSHRIFPAVRSIATVTRSFPRNAVR